MDNPCIDSCLKPLYNGNLLITATFFCLQGARCREVQLYKETNVPTQKAMRYIMNSNGTELEQVTYFRLSGFQSSLPLIHFRHGPNTCSHCTKVRHRTYPICDATLSRSVRHSFCSLCYRDRAEITVLICEQKPYPV